MDPAPRSPTLSQWALVDHHFLEANDLHHRYGSALQPYYEAWKLQSPDANHRAFFAFLDGPEGALLDLSDHINCSSCRYLRAPSKPPVSRAVLEKSRLDYCDTAARRAYVVVVSDGRLVWACDGPGWAAGQGIDTSGGKFIFVMGLDGTLYVGRKERGRFHHSSFLAGGRVLAAGRIIACDGRVEALAAQSGHYKPDAASAYGVMEVLAAAGLEDADDVRILGKLK